MKPSLLATKTFLPPVPLYLIPRAELEERLSAALHAHHRLILVSAPPGSGKSSLVSAWSSRHSMPLAWVSLEASDNDPIRFWAYFLGALEPYYPDGVEALMDGLGSTLTLPPQFLPELVNLMCSRPGSLVVALDDYHLVESPEIHQGIQYLVEHLPAQICIALLTRVDPPLPVHRWRARGQLTEIRASDLRFSLEETAQFLNLQMGLKLLPGDIEKLEERTEGWVTGLQLAALSMRGRSDPQDFIDKFSGSHHFILEYLMNEVFALQEEPVQGFLLATSILESLCASLCEAVLANPEQRAVNHTGSPTLAPARTPAPGAHLPRVQVPGGAGECGVTAHDSRSSQSLLEYLGHSNLFLVSLDDERTWFRYHHLFRDFLSQRLKRQEPDRVPDIHKRAAAWYSENRMVEAGLRHALAAGDIPLAVEIARRHAIVAASEGRSRELVGWLEMLPPQAVAADLQLTVIYAWMLVAVGKTNSIGSLIDQAERLLKSGEIASMTADERQYYLGQLAALRAMQAAREGDLEATKAHVAEARRYSAPQNATVQGLAWLAEANLQREMGDFEQAIEAYNQALPLVPAAQVQSGTNNMITVLGQAYMVQGRLWEAEELYRTMLERSGVSGQAGAPALGILQCDLAGTAYEKNDLSAAQTLFEAAEAHSKRSGMVDLLVNVSILGARLSRADGNLPGAILRLKEAEKLVHKADAPNLFAELSAWRARYHAEAGALAEAAVWAGDVKPCPDHNPGYTQGVELFILVRVLTRQGKPQEALALAGKLESLARRSGSLLRVIEAAMLQSEVLWGLGRRAESVQHLGESLDLAEAAGFVRVFIDEGEKLVPVLQAIQPSSKLAGFAGSLLALLSQESTPAGPGREILTRKGVEELTGRELDVLRDLAQGLSYPQIAAHLVISTGTVKTHVSHIYGKLGVTGAVQAIQRAKELRII